MNQNPRIFLSSTFIDLAPIRDQLSHFLSGIFGVDLIIMETFGSDASPPDVNSARRVRECDLFVGLYAHRYGTIDPASGKSITELELDEAEHGFSSGTLTDILLYVLDRNAPWPEELKENSPTADMGLARLREKTRHHTYTIFREENDLLFSVLRDVFRRLRPLMGTQALEPRPLHIPAARAPYQPIGMEFLTSEFRDYLIGRDAKVREVTDVLTDSAVVLLLGDSGVGKTSLIHAGLLPALIEHEWRPVYARPFGLPYDDVVRQVQAASFASHPPVRGRLLPILAELSELITQTKVVLIIDQFEDILTARDPESVWQLVSELRTINEMADPTMRVVLSYRADLEGRLGQYWQQISGSPLGLPRVYVEGVDETEAWEGIAQSARDLGISLDLTAQQEQSVSQELATASRVLGLDGVYPPYVQIFIEHMWSVTDKGHIPYVFDAYKSAGTSERIIGGYLTRQLAYVKDIEGNVRSVLISLVRSYGRKAQKTMDEIVTDTVLSRNDCDVALERLIDLRLVRHINEYYEVSHDFVARTVSAELVDSEEREFKRFRELLGSKASAYATTQAVLTSEELLMLYKHRERLLPSEAEARLLLVSWIRGAGPALFWIFGIEAAKILHWLDTEAAASDRNSDEKAAIALLEKKLGQGSTSAQIYQLFRSYQLSAEMAALIIHEDPSKISDDLLQYGLCHRREEIRASCIEAVVKQIQNGKWDWVKRLRRSSSPAYRRAYAALTLREDVPAPEGDADKILREVRTLKTLSACSTLKEIRLARESLPARLPGWLQEFADGLALFRSRKISQLLNRATRASARRAEMLLAAINGEMSADEFDLVLGCYANWSKKEREEYRGPAHLKASALAEAVRRCASDSKTGALRRTLTSVALRPSARGIVLALLEHATEADVKFILDRVAGEEDYIDLWNHTGLGIALAQRMEDTVGFVPTFLQNVVAKMEFWEYVLPSERYRHAEERLLGVKEPANRRLYIRLAAYATIGASNTRDSDLLMRLATHDYGLIARAAAARLVRLLGQRAIDLLTTKIDSALSKGRANELAQAVRQAELVHYEVIRSS